MQYMLDTNVLVHVLNGRAQHKSVFERFNQADSRELCVSSITLAELRFGVERSLVRNVTQLKLTRLVDALDIASFDASAAHAYGALRAQLQKAGKPIGPLDILIAAHALSLGLTLVTNNLREFSRVPGLRVEDWLTG